jgi:hypothetical protein
MACRGVAWRSIVFSNLILTFNLRCQIHCRPLFWFKSVFSNSSPYFIFCTVMSPGQERPSGGGGVSISPMRVRPMGIGVRHGVSKMVEDVCRPPALRAGHPPDSCKAVSGVARPQGIEGSSMAGPGETLGSPWPPLAIRPCLWASVLRCYDIRVLVL